MTNPTPEEITAAHALLRRVPGFTDRTTLADVVAVLEPTALLAASLKGLLVERDVDIRDAHFMDVATLLADLAARHGLRITTDPEPGELIQFRLVRRAANGWFLHDPSVSYKPSQGGLDVAESDRAKYIDREGCCPRIVAVRLLPEGGKA